MKKIVLVISLLLSFCAVRAQDTLYMSRASQPIFLPWLPYLNSRYHSMLQPFASDDLNSDGLNSVFVFRYILPSGVRRMQVAGVAFQIGLDWPTHTAQGALVTLPGGSADWQHPTVHLTNTMSHYRQAPDCYISFYDTSEGKHCEGVIDTVVPAIAYYFDEPITVTDTFYLGSYLKREMWYGHAGDSIFGFHNCMYGDHPYYGIFGLKIGLADDDSTITSVVYNNQRSIWAFCPIMAPDTDMYDCPVVEGLRVMGEEDVYPGVQWDAGDDYDLYEVACGPAGEPMDSLWHGTTSNTFLETTDEMITSNGEYKVMVRARCHFQDERCGVDTMTWSPWCDPVFFTYNRDTSIHGNDTTTHGQPDGVTLVESDLPFAIVSNPAKKGVGVSVHLGEQVVLEGLELTLHDAAGHELLRQKVYAHQFDLSTKSLPSGVYLLTLSSTQGRSSHKLVIE